MMPRAHLARRAGDHAPQRFTDRPGFVTIVVVRLLAIVLSAMLATGCVAERPPPKTPVAVESPEYQQGYVDGQRAGEEEFVGGYYAGGFVAGLAIVVVIAVLVAAAGGGGSGGNCGGCNGCGGGGGGDGGDDDLPAHVAGRTPEYVAGWRAGFDGTYEPRKDAALMTGFLIGVVIFGGLAAYYLSDEKNREEVFGPNNAAIGFGIRF